MQAEFVHLRVHSEYSLVDGLVRIDDLVKAVADRGMNAVALTDHCNLFAVVKFYQAARAKGLKSIIGADLVCYHPDKPNDTFNLLMLCQNEQGYRNLTCLISRAYQEGQVQGLPRINTAWFESMTDGLIVLSGGRLGDIGLAILADDNNQACLLAKRWMSLFPNRFYIEIQRTHRQDEARYNEQVVKLADSLALPLVATNDVRFIDESDFDAHEARVCIHEGFTLGDNRRPKMYSSHQYLRSLDEMMVLFKDLPQALKNSIEIAKRCTVKLTLGKNYLPDFPTPNQIPITDYLTQLAGEGLDARLCVTHADRDTYQQRLQLELDVINAMGFAGYFLIVADFIQWAKDNDIPVGPGRGSGAGSLVAYALKITDLDPIPYELLFERFLNPERVSMPDFDVDFCMVGRDRVIDYVAEKYGRQAVSQIITFGTMAAKAVVRDVGRVLSHNYGFVDKIAKLIPFELGITLSKALELEPELASRYKDEEEVKELIDLALKLEGITRNAGKHAGGVVIAPSKLTDFTAIYCEQDSTQIVSQLDKDDVEAVGLVKFDFLGLKTLTIIDWAQKAVNTILKAKNEPLINIVDIPLDCPKTFELLKACQTTAVFQLESRGMKDLISRLKPDCFEEIIALVALFRPGPLQSGMVDDFINRKHGLAAVVYPHPDLEPILRPTYGVILYQEQVMQIAQVLANYTLGGADLLRRAMGKKKPEEMAKQREIFVTGASARDVDEKVASDIFDLMEKFAGYGFNKSHSAAYALLSYQTAWLKTHYKAPFMAAVLSADLDNTDKVVIFIEDAEMLGITVLPPNIQTSHYHFTALDVETIAYGLGAIKGVGEGAIESIIEARLNGGAFTGLNDFCQRVDVRKVNRRVLEAMIKAGAMDDFKVERSALMASISNALKLAESSHKNVKSGQRDLFSILEESETDERYVQCKPWSTNERLKGEKDVLGFYLSGHPACFYQKEFKAWVHPISALNPSMMKKAWVCAQLLGIRRILTKRGKNLVILSLEDKAAKMDVVLFAEAFEGVLAKLQAGMLIVVEGEVAHDTFNGGVKITASTILTIDEARTRFANSLKIQLSQQDEEKLPKLQALLQAHPGDLTVQFVYANDDARAHLTCGVKWRVNPSEDLLSTLEILLGSGIAELSYA